MSDPLLPPSSTVPADVSDPAAAEREPCPTPLEWQEVLRAFLTDADHWYLGSGKERITGRTWGAGPPLYFLNGVGGTHELFSLTAWLLRDNYRCVLFDYPSRRRIRVEELSDLLRQVAEHHGDRAIHLFATGFGTLPAWDAAQRYPELIQSVIAQGGLTGLSLSLLERLLARTARVLPIRFGRVPGRWSIQQRSHRPWFPPYDQGRWQFFLDNTGHVPLREVAGRFLAAAQYHAEPQLPQIRQPVLLISSEGEGPVQQRAQAALSAGLPHAVSECLHTSGQLPFLTHPHRLVKLITNFLDSLGVEPAEGSGRAPESAAKA